MLLVGIAGDLIDSNVDRKLGGSYRVHETVVEAPSVGWSGLGLALGFV